jgi:hypothetical protein
MKILKWFFRFTGLNQIQLIVKIVINIITLVLIAYILYLAYSGFMGAWQYIAQKEPQTKQKIGTLYSDLLLKDDSLKTANNQVIILSNESLKKDSVIFDQSELLKSKDSQILQHQKNNYDLKKQLDIYRKDNRVCYKYEKVGTFLNKEWQWIEIPCTDIKD